MPNHTSSKISACPPPVTQDCDAIWQNAGGQSVAAAGVSGVMQGLAGLIGAGGFWNPVDSGPLTKSTDDFTNLQKTLDALQQSKQNTIMQSQQTLVQEQQAFTQMQSKYAQEILTDNVAENKLLIQIIILSMIIIIIYLIVL